MKLEKTYLNCFLLAEFHLGRAKLILMLPSSYVRARAKIRNATPQDRRRRAKRGEIFWANLLHHKREDGAARSAAKKIGKFCYITR